MRKHFSPARTLCCLVLLLFLIWASGCAPAIKTPSTVPTGVSEPTLSPTRQSEPTASPAPSREERSIELEWPETIYLGESDVIRLSLIPTREGYIAQAEYPEHQVSSQPVLVEYLPGYALVAAGQLSAAGFDISPEAEQRQSLRNGAEAVFRWTISPRSPGQQRMAVSLRLIWVPLSAENPVEQEFTIYSRSVQTRVRSFLGLNRQSALGIGFITLFLGTSMSLGGLLAAGSKKNRGLRQVKANPALSIEPPPGMLITGQQTALLQGLFSRYQRLVVKSEFLSGYSGARTLLVIPVHANGQSDAATIVKIGSRESIEREYDNYDKFVKDRLPPITARIQHTPITLAGSPQGAVQYTFIGAPGQLPTSLRMALLETGDASQIQQLFATFGPNWWMQRSPYTFRLAQEYDRVLPPHLTLEPCQGQPTATLGETFPLDLPFQPGQILSVGSFRRAELRADARSYSLLGLPVPGQPPLRIRWLNSRPPSNTTARVTATRFSQLHSWIAGLDRFGLPDPTTRLNDLLNETLQGSQSIIHGDLNLENVLVGPGGLIWLIDFSETREGHTLFDASHLAAELVVHILSRRYPQPAAYLSDLQHGSLPFLRPLEEIAGKWLFNPSQPDELKKSFGLACLGALKYGGLSDHARHLLLLTSAFYLQ